MSNNYTPSDLLIQFLDGELEEPQRQSLEKDLQTNLALRQELENLRLTQQAVKTFGLKNRVAQVRAEMLRQQEPATIGAPAKVRRLFYYTARVAALVILVMGSAVIYQYFSATPQSLFGEKFQPFVLHESRGQTPTPLEQSYQKGEMGAVIQLFREGKVGTDLPPQSPQEWAEASFLAGNAYLKTGKYSEAIAAFTSLQETNRKNNTGYFEADSEFFLAMAYLASQQPALALPWLQKIHDNPSHPYHSLVNNWYIQKLHHTL